MQRKKKKRNSATQMQKKETERALKKTGKRKKEKTVYSHDEAVEASISTLKVMSLPQGYGPINMLLRIRSEIFLKRLLMICIAGLPARSAESR